MRGCGDYFEHAQACRPARSSQWIFAYIQEVHAVNERRGGSGWVLAAAMAPWLMRWMLLRDAHHRVGPPGEDELHLVHVVCPEGGCNNESWVTLYEVGTVTRCSRHRPRIAMVRCRKCARTPGYHRPGKR